MLHIKGARMAHATEVPLAHSSLNMGDCFMLDKGLKLYLYHVPEANRAEKTKVLELILRIRDMELSGRADLILVNEWEKDDENKYKDFGTAFGEERKPVTKKGGADIVAEETASEKISLVRVSEMSGKLTLRWGVCVGGERDDGRRKRGGDTLGDHLPGEIPSVDINMPVKRVMKGGEMAVHISYFAEWNAPLPMGMGSSWINSSASSGVALPPPSPPRKAIQSTEARPCWIKEQQQQLQQEKEMELKRGITGKVRCRCGVWRKRKRSRFLPLSTDTFSAAIPTWFCTHVQRRRGRIR